MDEETRIARLKKAKEAVEEAVQEVSLPHVLKILESYCEKKASEETVSARKNTAWCIAYAEIKAVHTEIETVYDDLVVHWP